MAGFRPKAAARPSARRLIYLKGGAARQLRFITCAATMGSMSMSRSLRRLVAGLAAVLLLACHGLALAVSAGAPGTSQGAAQGPCHDFGGDPSKSTSGGACQAGCQPQPLPSPSPGALPAADPPAIPARIGRVAAVAGPAIATETRPQAEPLPLPILHCRLRN
ncbi:MAG TPA: hypothetical protein VNK67_03440 [Burkholderiales bacterium]|nr:hypothetical protein [Burkholderiales bacterium]